MAANIVEALRTSARPAPATAADLDEALAAIGDARFILLGEASHGTQEFYSARAAITRRLIVERSLGAVAVEDAPETFPTGM